MKRVSVRRFFFLLACLSLAGFGCDTTSPITSRITPSSPIMQEEYDVWRTVGSDISRFEVSPAQATSTHLILYRLRPEAFRWSFEYASSAQRISDWASEKPGTNVIVNATYFDPDFSPSGYFTVGGTRIGRRQFDLDRSSLLRLRPLPEIVETVKSQADLLSERNAAQSYPLLIGEGKPTITEDSGLLARRTAIGTDVQGRIYIILAPDQPVSLYGFMRQLASMDVQWKSVLNLDGGPSTGAILRSGNWSEMTDSFTSVPIVLTARHL